MFSIRFIKKGLPVYLDAGGSHGSTADKQGFLAAGGLFLVFQQGGEGTKRLMGGHIILAAFFAAIAKPGINSP
jgi:hypothetical protein